MPAATRAAVNGRVSSYTKIAAWFGIKAGLMGCPDNMRNVIVR